MRSIAASWIYDCWSRIQDVCIYIHYSCNSPALHAIVAHSILSIVPFIILHTAKKIMIIIYLIYCQNNRNL